MTYALPATYPDGSRFATRDRAVLLDAAIVSQGEWVDYAHADVEARTGINFHSVRLALRHLSKHGFVDYRPSTGGIGNRSRIRATLPQA